MYQSIQRISLIKRLKYEKDYRCHFHLCGVWWGFVISIYEEAGMSVNSTVKKSTVRKQGTF